MSEKMAPEPGTTFLEVFPDLDSRIKRKLTDVFKIGDLISLQNSFYLTPDQALSCCKIALVFRHLFQKDSSVIKKIIESDEEIKFLYQDQKNVCELIKHGGQGQLEQPFLFAPDYQNQQKVEECLAKLKTPIQRLNFISGIVEQALLAVN